MNKKTLKYTISEFIWNQYFKEQSELKYCMDILDKKLECLSKYVGRKLTEREQMAILDIVDENTAKGDDGNYLGSLFPFEFAWKIYETEKEY
ncbi:MAG: hypothetical protein KGI50_00415 [Patescibacteria group bacterium]|nr:hypothetical protein [Patescibacteria group bacterium]MDE2438181.1 hypothetical protein [Patescibacteria group bacterium]